MLYLISLGINDKKDLSLKSIEAGKKCDKLFWEGYTHKYQSSKEELEEIFGQEIKVLKRKEVEEGMDKILKQAKTKKIGLLIGGSCFAATTHISYLIESKKKKIKVKVIEGGSIFTGVGMVGLELYKYGKTTSIPYAEKGYEPEVFYDVIKENKEKGLHTLVLLDIKSEEAGREGKGRFMTVNEAIRQLLRIEIHRGERVFTEQTLCVGCARLGGEDFMIKSGKAGELLKEDFGREPHCLIVPGELHFVEKEAINMWR